MQNKGRGTQAVESMTQPADNGEPVAKLNRGRRQAALGFIFATALMDIIALGIMIPVLPNLVKAMSGGDLARAALATGVFASCWGVMQFFCSPIQGMLSDRFGRRPVLLISILGMSIDYVFMALAPTLAWLFVGRMINGACSASFSTASAYIADISKPEDRARNFGLIGAAFGVGFFVGPGIGGFLSDPDTVRHLGTLIGGARLGQVFADHHLRIPFYVAAAMGSINWLYGLLILPESLPPERRATRFEWKRANPVGSLRLLRAHPDLTGLAGVSFLFNMAHNVLPSIFVLYVGQRFGWGPKQAGLMMMATGAMNIVSQAFLIRPAVKRLGERGCLLVGLAGATLGFIVYALAPSPAVFLSAIPIFACTGLINPGLQGLMSRRVAPNEQGQLQGANSAIMGITAIIGPQLYTGLLAWAVLNEATLHLPGLPILVAAFLIGSGYVLALNVGKVKQVDPLAASV
jgi:DHA1 family tetracycline resistance protein-like MFS transporter